MSRSKNIIANYTGQVWSAIMQFAFIPLYIRYLGLEAYGLIGIYITLLSVIMIFDMGFSPATTREVARFKSGDSKLIEISALINSIEIIFLAITLILLLGTYFSNEWLATNWIKSNNLENKLVEYSLLLMSGMGGLKLIENLYKSVIIGLQEQVYLNINLIIFTTLRWLGAAIVVYLTKNIVYFFAWQIFTSLLNIIVFKRKVNKYLYQKRIIGKFSKASIINIWDFSRGMILTIFLSMVLTQADKLILSKIIDLENFGYYIVASNIASGLMMLVTPLTQAYYPKFIEFVGKNEYSLNEIYHEASQLMAAIIWPVGIVMMFYSHQLIWVWTGSLVIADGSWLLTSILVFGSTVLAIMNIPYTIQLSHGMTMFGAKVNFILVVVLIPVTYILSINFGSYGAATSWAMITSSYIIFVIPLMHRYILKGEMIRWYLDDNLKPLLIALILVGCSKIIMISNLSRISTFIYLACLAFIAIILATLSTKVLRNNLLIFSKKIYVK